MAKKIVVSDLQIASKGSSEGLKSFNEFLHFYDRGGDILKNDKPSYTVEQAAVPISGGTSWKPLFGGGEEPVNVTYSFRTSADDSMFQRAGIEGFSEFSDQQKSQARLAVQSWSDLANIRITEVGAGESSNVTFGNYAAGRENSSGFNASSSLLGTIQSAQIWLNQAQNANPESGNYARLTLAHEFGHSLGLAHPADYDAADGGAMNYADRADYAEDSLGYTLMSYWSESNTNQSFSKGNWWEGNAQAFASAPLIDDIAAIQRVYGANMTTRTEDTVYGFNSNTDRDFYTVSSDASKPIFSVWDAGGVDTLDFSGFSQNQKINLSASSFSDVGGMVGNVSIAQGVTLENAIGGSGNDLLIGNEVVNELKGGAGNDILFGGLGADKLWGGEGSDTFVFNNSNQSVLTGFDQILDFVTGQDKIDLSGMAGFNSGGLSLSFVSVLTGQAGQAMLSYDDVTSISELAIDFGGDNNFDFMIQVIGQPSVADIVV